MQITRSREESYNFNFVSWQAKTPKLLQKTQRGGGGWIGVTAITGEMVKFKWLIGMIHRGD